MKKALLVIVFGFVFPIGAANAWEKGRFSHPYEWIAYGMLANFVQGLCMDEFSSENLSCGRNWLREHLTQDDYNYITEVAVEYQRCISEQGTIEDMLIQSEIFGSVEPQSMEERYRFCTILMASNMRFLIHHKHGYGGHPSPHRR